MTGPSAFGNTQLSQLQACAGTSGFSAVSPFPQDFRETALCEGSFWKLCDRLLIRVAAEALEEQPQSVLTTHGVQGHLWAEQMTLGEAATHYVCFLSCVTVTEKQIQFHRENNRPP